MSEKENNSQGQKTSKVTVASLVLAVLGSIVVIIVLALAVLSGVRPSTPTQFICAKNLTQLRKAMRNYVSENGRFPTASKWCDLLLIHTDVTEEQFRCPGAPEGPCNYAMNENVEKLQGNYPADIVLLFDSVPGWNQSGGPDLLSPQNHEDDGLCVVLFTGGRVSYVKWQELAELKWQDKQKQ